MEQTLLSLLTSSAVSGNHTAVLQAGKPTQDRYLLQGDKHMVERTEEAVLVVDGCIRIKHELDRLRR